MHSGPLLAVVLALASAACSAADAPPDCTSRVQELMNEVRPPEGFTATIFATPEEANYPVFVAATPTGTLFVSSDGNGSLGGDPGRGRVLRLRDTDDDGAADEVKPFVANLDSTRGLLWVDDRLIVLDDGRPLLGFVTSEGAETVTLRDGQGMEHTVQKDTIEDRTRLPTSLMPEGLVSDLTVGQFASLLDFIESIGK